MNFSNDILKVKNLILKKQNVFYIFVIFTIFILDRISKIKVLQDINETVFFINNFLNLELIWNIGIGFGFLSTDSFIFYNSVTILIGSVILVLFYVFLTSKNLDKLIYSIIIGGACGNFYDRIAFSAVPDFIDIHYGNFHWFTFNVADIFITVGILTFIIRGFFVKD